LGSPSRSANKEHPKCIKSCTNLLRGLVAHRRMISTA
jgi:hypothetical protein